VTGARSAAQRRLRRFRQASLVAVALAGLLLLIWGVPAEPTSPAGPLPVPASPPAVGVEQEASTGMPAGARAQAGAQQPRGQTGVPPQGGQAEADTAAAEAARSVEEATGTIRDLVVAFYGFLPKLLIALVLLAAAAVLARLVRPLLGRLLASWARAEAFSALAAILIWLLALGAALSVLAGDARALIGSVGLFGLALSWALQAPIESFSAWLLNSFRGYYRVGDRIGVGDVFGDVARIDLLTTTVWEAGGPEKPVQGAQPTGALITFPNSELLRTSIINYTRDFPYVWDEVTVQVANESDMSHALRVFAAVARRVLGPAMEQPAADYLELLRAAGLGYDIAAEPQAYLSQAEAWTNVTVRYLVPARERRYWASELLRALSEETAKPEHRGRIVPGYPRRDVAMLRSRE